MSSPRQAAGADASWDGIATVVRRHRGAMVQPGTRHVWWTTGSECRTLGKTCPPFLSPRMPRRRREPDPIAEAFGRAVRAQRDESGLTLEELGHRMGQPDGKHLGEVERGYHSPTITTAKRIADALGVPLATLVADL